jgi:hypothetical protein
MRALLLLSLVALVPAATVQAGEKENADARAALELSLALSKSSMAVKPLAPHAAKRIDFEAAYAVSMRTGKPMLLHVGGFDCADVCKECHDCIHADAATVKGDATPRLIVAYPSGEWLAVQREFRRVPKLAEVRAELSAIEAAKVKRNTIADCPPGR